jgi:HlyD family secretion protein
MSDANLNSFLGVKPRSKVWRILKWAGIGFAVIIVLLIVLRIVRGPAPSQYAMATVIRGDLTVSVSATGNLVPTRQINVGSQESGLIDKVFVQNNDHVVPGERLAQLDLSTLRDALVQSQASLESALAAVRQSQATLVQDQANLDRLQALFKASQGAAPSRTDLDAARADQARAGAHLAQAKAQVALARAQVLTSKTNLSRGTIYSPVKGVVLSRQVEPGQTVAATFNVATLFTIAEDLTKMKLEVKVDEADVGAVHPGEAATFTVDAYPGREFPATVTRVDLGANATPTVNSAGTVVTPTTSVVAYTTTLSVSNTAKMLKPGMTATAEIVTEHVKNVLLVANAALRYAPPAAAPSGLFKPPPGSAPAQPKAAIVGRGAHRQLWILNAAGKPQAIDVVIGDTDGSLTEVSGPQVHAGLKVITGLLVKTAAPA